MNAKEKAKRIRLGNAALLTAYRIGKARTDADESLVSQMLGIAKTSLWSKKNDPGTFRLRELRTLAFEMQWTAEEWLAIGGYEKLDCH